MIPVDAPLVAFLAVVAFLVALPCVAIAVVIVDIRMHRALSAQRQRVDDLVRKLLVAPGRRPMGFVLRGGDSERRPRGADVYEPAPSEDAAGVVRERAG